MQGVGVVLDDHDAAQTVRSRWNGSLNTSGNASSWPCAVSPNAREGRTLIAFLRTSTTWSMPPSPGSRRIRASRM